MKIKFRGGGNVVEGYSYDPFGKTKILNGAGGDGKWLTADDSVSSVSSVASYEYDGANNRISRTVNGVKTKYINDVGMGLTQVLMETDNAGTVQATYNYGNDLISMNRANANSYYHYDGLGTVRLMTDDLCLVTNSYTYDAFGNSVSSVSSVANTYGFTGEQQFAETDNLVFLRARYYQPSYGRFTSKDPIGYRGGLNLYGYVMNNPIIRIDPSGFDYTIPPGMGIPPISMPSPPAGGKCCKRYESGWKVAGFNSFSECFAYVFGPTDPKTWGIGIGICAGGVCKGIVGKVGGWGGLVGGVIGGGAAAGVCGFPVCVETGTTDGCGGCN